MKYQGPAPEGDIKPCTGILLTNLGTPDSTTVADVRRYLKEFLSDPRVVETPRLIWWPVLHGIILRTRPKRSAAAYRKIWTGEGSPLLVHSERLAIHLQEMLEERIEGRVKVVLAMRYGNPSIADGLEKLRTANAQRLIILPLYPQYSATTTASTFDAISETLRRWRWMPQFRFITHYHDDPGYIRALANSVRTFWQQQGEPDRLLFSFHGIPQDYAEAGDPYPEECMATGELLARELGLEQKKWAVTFQSRMGPKEWIKPYTNKTLKQWGKEGAGKVHALCPGFPADCLETIEEMGKENRDHYLSAGGQEYHYIPALNDDRDHVNALADLILKQG